MLRLLKYFLLKSAASPLECLTDNSGDVSRSIYSNLCLDRKNGYQHVCPHLDADSSGQAELSTCTSRRHDWFSSSALAAFSCIPRGVCHIEFLYIFFFFPWACLFSSCKDETVGFFFFFFKYIFFFWRGKNWEKLSVRDRVVSYFGLPVVTVLLYICHFPKCSPQGLVLREWKEKNFFEILLSVWFIVPRRTYLCVFKSIAFIKWMSSMCRAHWSMPWGVEGWELIASL